jgi:hypothetical protein
VIVLRDPEDADRYLSGLRDCFSEWGGKAEWRWVFDRDAGGGPGTRLVVADESGGWIAGSGISWRMVAGLGFVGIMTGSWTRPEARGRGCFTTLVRESSAVVAERGGLALLSFVTESNASRRRLEASGALMIPTTYGRSSAPFLGPSASLVEENPTPSVQEELVSLQARCAVDGRTFQYPAPSQILDQYLHRPTPVTVYHHLTTGGLVLLERRRDTDHLIFAAARGEDPLKLSSFWSGLAAWSGAQGRKFFGFASDPAQRQAIAQSGLDEVVGFLAVNAPSANRTMDPGPLRNPASPVWALQSGDRM